MAEPFPNESSEPDSTSSGQSIRPDMGARDVPRQGSSVVRRETANRRGQEGSSVRRASTATNAPVDGEEQPTVISTRPPVHAAMGSGGATPRELGLTLIGRSLAHFQLTEYVGGGGMGAVFRALDTMLHRVVAVKVLSRDHGSDEETVRRFQNEAQSTARLDHENIARVYYVGEDDGWYFIVFEFIEGQNLRDLVAERGPLPWQQAIQITLQLLEALDHAAHREVVHRDIKPSNVLLTPTGKTKLVDMGLARLRPERGSVEDLTASGVTLGTFDYISPEQARDPRTADGRSDIYSLGCTLYFMLTGRPPFPEGTVLQKLLSHNSESPPDPRSLRPELPVEITPIVHRMLAKQPADRYQRPAELIGDLLLLAEHYGLTLSTRVEPIWIQPEPTPSQRLQRHLPWMVPAILLLVGLFVLDPLLFDGGRRASAVPRFEIPSLPEAPTESPGKSTEPTNRRAANTEDADTRPRATDAEKANERRTQDAPLANANATERVTTPTIPSTTNGGTAKTPATDRSNPTTLSTRTTIIVDRSAMPRSDDQMWTVSDLNEACRLAASDRTIETIEIRHQGRLELAPTNFALNGRRLRMVAGRGFVPVIVVRAGIALPEVSDNDMSATGLVGLDASELVLEDIHWEMIVPDATLGGEWALFQLTPGATLRMHRATLTVQNSYGGRYSNLDNISLVRCLPAGDRLGIDNNRVLPLITLDWTDCVIRGEMTVLRAAEATPLDWSWQNGLLACSEHLAYLGGLQEPSRAEESFRARFRHVTFVADQGLVELDCSAAAPYLLPVILDCERCVVQTQRAPLVNQSGPQDVEGFITQLSFQGQDNAYEGMDTFWQISSTTTRLREVFDFERWRLHWNEVRSTRDQLRWRYTPDKNLPLHEHGLSDYAVVPNVSTRTVPATGQPTSAPGFISPSLPRVPEPSSPPPRKTRPFFQR